MPRVSTYSTVQFCGATSLYTFTNKDGESDYKFEREFDAKFGDQIIPVVKKLVCKEPISYEEKLDLSIFIGMLHYRDPATKLRILEPITHAAEKAISEIVDNTAQLTALLDGVVPIKATADEREKYERYVRSLKVTANNGIFLKAIADLGAAMAWRLSIARWEVMHAPKKASYIRSERTIYEIVDGHASECQGKFLRANEVIFVSLTKEIMLGIQFGHPEHMEHIQKDKDFVRLFNKMIVMNANQFLVGPDKALIANLRRFWRNN